MPTNANLVVVASNGKVSVGPTTTPAPTNVATALNAGFLEVGFISEEGATFTESKDITDINAWQSFYPIRKIVNSRSVQVSFAMREFNKRAIEFALGGTVTKVGSEWTYTPPSPTSTGIVSVVVEWFDGTKSYRLYFPTGIVSEAVESTLTRTAASDLPVTFSATDPGTGGSIYTLFTNDVAFSS
jgi:hypothetical protein